MSISSYKTAYLAGGCFWGLEVLLRRIPGVIETEVGYCGGRAENAFYEFVKQGNTGHAEALKIIFDASQLNYSTLLFNFFRMHNPTTRNQQGNDIGTPYRSAIFYLDAEQLDVIEQVIQRIDSSGKWHAPVVTEITPFLAFYRAENYHQNYLIKHPMGYNCHFIRDLDFGENSI